MRSRAITVCHSSWSIWPLFSCPSHVPSSRRAALEQELQSYPQLSEEQRAAALAEHERREREYSRLQRQRLCMDDFEPLKLIGKVGGEGW